MGMYTELCLAVNLKKDTPEDVVGMLEEACNGRGVWRWFQNCSYYFHANPCSHFEFDKIGDCHFLSVRCNLKNGGEIYMFLETIAPYVAVGGRVQFGGYVRYEEDDDPTLIYWDGNGGYKRMVITGQREV